MKMMGQWGYGGPSTSSWPIGMMGGSSGLWFLHSIFWIIILIDLILLGIWLWKQIQKK